MSNKIVRTICYFSDSPSEENSTKIAAVAKLLEDKGYQIQTRRLCTTLDNIDQVQKVTSNGVDTHSMGALTYEEALAQFSKFLNAQNLFFNIDLASEQIEAKHVDLLFRIIKENPSKTFNFAYTFNNVPSSPYFPSGKYEKNGFAIGLQPTDLAEGCSTLDEWLTAMQGCWQEIASLFAGDPDFLGIDSSVAPFQGGDSSFVHFIKRLGYTFEHSATTNLYTTITRHLKENNPKPTGLCGMMFPCLEDIELAAEYDNGNFTIERNVYLSLHSGLGIDTYPIGVDEEPERVMEILKLLQGLSNKYQKPLSVRFVSDGKAVIGSKTDFQHPYLTDCTIRAL